MTNNELYNTPAVQVAEGVALEILNNYCDYAFLSKSERAAAAHHLRELQKMEGVTIGVAVVTAGALAKVHK